MGSELKVTDLRCAGMVTLMTQGQPGQNTLVSYLW